MGNIYTSAMGMISYQNKLEVVGNNVANIKSTGYKKDHETFRVFEEGMRKIISSDKAAKIGPYQDEVHVDNVQTNFSPGLLKLTDRALDVSLDDKRDKSGNSDVSFFEVELNGKKYLTREGKFQIDNENNLSLMNGAYILDAKGQHIKVPKGVELSIDTQGTLVNKETGEEITKLQIRSVEQNNTGYIKKAFGNMFEVMSVEEIQNSFGPLNKIIGSFNENPSLQKILKKPNVLSEAQTTGQINIFKPVSDVNLRQQMLEESNVDVSYEMNEMLLAQKGFQANSKAAMTMDKINEKDANQIGV
jgi:flagellar basal body rod protein FlgG